MSRGLKFLLVLSIILIGVLPIHAQGNLSDEERAQVERAFKAVKARDDYETYVKHNIDTMEYHQDITLAGSTIAQEETHVLDATVSYIQGEKPNTHAVIKLDVKGTDQHGKTYSYTITAEARLVDDVLYVKAERGDEQGAVEDLPEMPDGWITFESEEDWPTLSDLSLDSYLPAGKKSPTLLDELEKLVGSASGVEVTSSTLDDGTPVDFIATTLDIAAYIDLIRNMPETTQGADSARTQALLDLVDPTSTLTIRIALDKNDVALRAEGDANMTWTQLDLSQIDSRWTGMTMNMTQRSTVTSEVSGIDEPLEPVTAPEVSSSAAPQ